MIKEHFTMTNDEGLHLRTAMLLCKIVKPFDSKNVIHFNNTETDIKSVLFIVALCITKGCEFDISCDGPQEEECMKAIKIFGADYFK